MIQGLGKGATLRNGTYVIEKVLGMGSFGITYLASAKITTQGNLGEMSVEAKVAIKEFFMSDVNVRDKDGSSVSGSAGSVFTNYRNRFRKEARNLSKLKHENIVKVSDVFDENNTTYYVMEFIEGTSLDDYIKQKGKLSETETINIIKEVGAAMGYMHSCRMLHLDIKPRNIMRKADGKYYLIDFGLSKQFDDEGAPESSTSIGLGTPGYAPVEQSSYKKDGTFPATLDVYALGATMFKMLTGRRPPESTTILNEGFPKSALSGAGVSAQTIAVVEKAMAPIKKDRYQDISSFMDDVDKDDATMMENDMGESTSAETTVLPKQVVSIGDGDVPISATGAKPRPKSKPVELRSPRRSGGNGPVVLPGDPHSRFQSKPRARAVQPAISADGQTPSNEGFLSKYKWILAGVCAVLLIAGVAIWAGGLFQGDKADPNGPETLVSDPDSLIESGGDKVIEPIDTGTNTKVMPGNGQDISTNGGNSKPGTTPFAVDGQATDHQTEPTESEIVEKGIAAYKKDKYDEAIKLLQKPADNGNVQAQVTLGFAYFANGNKSEAAKQLKKAAEKGSFQAQSALGEMYYLGNGVPKDYEEARRLLLNPAKNGDDVACLYLGIMYYDGLGGNKDSEEAKKWLTKASNRGNDDATRMLRSIK